LVKLSKTIKKIFESKKEYRKRLAQFPIEKKFGILLQLQRNVYSILRPRGLGRKPWMTSEFFPIQNENLPNFKNMISSKIEPPHDKNWIKFFDSRIATVDGHGYSSIPVHSDFQTSAVNSRIHEFRGPS